MRAISVGDGGEPPVATRTGGSKRTPFASGASASMISTVGAPLKWVTRSDWISRITRPGSIARSITCVPPTAATAQGKHQPLQWNSGSVQR